MDKQIQNQEEQPQNQGNGTINLDYFEPIKPIQKP